MLDRHIRPLIDPGLNRLGARIAHHGISANEVTLAGLGFGLAAALMLALGVPGGLALVPLLIGRLLDGLDGAVARATGGKSDFGGYLDLLCDFAFYGAVPLAFALRSAENAPVAAFLLCSFYINGASFLGYAALAAKHGIETKAQGVKSLYYSAGLLEGTETVLFFIALCLWPEAFRPLALAFGLLCLVTATARALMARRVFAGPLESG